MSSRIKWSVKTFTNNCGNVVLWSRSDGNFIINETLVLKCEDGRKLKLSFVVLLDNMYGGDKYITCEEFKNNKILLSHPDRAEIEEALFEYNTLQNQRKPAPEELKGEKFNILYTKNFNNSLKEYFERIYPTTHNYENYLSSRNDLKNVMYKSKTHQVYVENRNLCIKRIKSLLRQYSIEHPDNKDTVYYWVDSGTVGTMVALQKRSKYLNFINVYDKLDPLTQHSLKDDKNAWHIAGNDKKGELKVVMGYIMHYLYEKSNT